MRELTEHEKQFAKAFTTHRFPEDKGANVMMLLSLVHDLITAIWEEDMSQEERDLKLSEVFMVMKDVQKMTELRSSQDGKNTETST